MAMHRFTQYCVLVACGRPFLVGLSACATQPRALTNFRPEIEVLLKLAFSGFHIELSARSETLANPILLCECYFMNLTAQF
jgi:hypothetical protein